MNQRGSRIVSFLIPILLCRMPVAWGQESTQNQTIWNALPPARQRRLLTNHQRFLKMNAEERKLIQDRWQTFRHMPPWQQAQLLKKFEDWKKSTPTGWTTFLKHTPSPNHKKKSAAASTRNDH